jgi:5-methylcytosine-specific restriction endonuclease McrA
MTYNTKKPKNRRTMKTSGALRRLFDGRKHRPCAYCGCRLSLGVATFDHVRALSKGGYDKTRNGAIACRSCNGRKGAKSKDQFMKELRA